MDIEQKIIVAFEFGSSAICGIAGYRNPDGKFNILGLEIERKPESIQRGVIYNIDTTTNAIKSIVERLNSKLKTQITRAYVGLAGQSLHSVENEVERELETKVKVTEEIVDSLKDTNLDEMSRKYENSEVHHIVPQEYYIGHSQVINPVGVQAEQIKACYVNIIARKALRENIEQCMAKAGLEIVDILISPLMLANSLLTDNDKRSGCALVDFGAGTTTVLVYTNNILRKLVVLPIGGNNITADIANCTKTFQEEAESIKRKYGVAFVANKKENPQPIEISNYRTTDENEIQYIVGARQEEIITNVWFQVKEESEKLLAGIFVTGGAALIKGMDDAIRHITNFDRLRTAKPLITRAEVAQNVSTPTDVNVDTLIALLLSGDKNENCVSGAPVLPVDGEKAGGSGEDSSGGNGDVGNTEGEPAPKPGEDEDKEGKKGKKRKKSGSSLANTLRSIGSKLAGFVAEEEEDEDD